MKLSDYKNDYYQFTTLASTTSRQLALAGIALIWVFKIQGETGYQLPNDLLFPTIGLIISLGSDLLQYVTASITWGVFHRYHEKQRNEEINPELEHSPFLNWPILFFFYLKIIAVLVSYFYLLKYAASSVTFD